MTDQHEAPDHRGDHPGVLVRPPRLYLGGLVLGGVAEYFWPSPALLGAPWRYVVGGLLAAAGIAGVVAAARRFRRAGTNIPTVQPATVLVTDGLHGLSRNPIYVCLSLIYLGIALAAGGLWMVLLLVLILPVMHFGVVRREEAYLETKFSDAYRRYKARVRRWL